jgi:hypothetical protein
MAGGTVARAVPTLSKSRYQKGLQCLRQLWLECYRKDLADPIPEARQAVFDMGHLVGRLAHLRFPGGVHIEAGYREGARALEQTRQAMSKGAGVLFEPAFDGGGVFVRVDILLKADSRRWHLIEVKQSGEAKAEHVTDAAVQLYSLEQCGVSVGPVSILHVNKEYVWWGGDHDPERLFALQDVTDGARAHLAEVPARLTEMRSVLQGPCPEVRFGKHCNKPYDCSFLGHCRSGLPDFAITDLPWVTDEQLAALQADGILAVGDIPPLYPGLQARQRTVCRVAAERRVAYGRGLRGALAGLDYPVFFLDFETIMPALPLYPGTRPYQTIPVQWSLHRLAADGGLEHFEYLHEEPTDPRPHLVEALLERLGAAGSIVVYSPFEGLRLRQLAEELPAYAAPLNAIGQRLFDLERVIRAHVQHHGFRGRSSLKKVLPALVPDLSYEGLAIRDGETAMNRYQEAMRRSFVDDERRLLFEDLKKYCALDTAGLLGVFQHLAQHVGAEVGVS